MPSGNLHKVGSSCTNEQSSARTNWAHSDIVEVLGQSFRERWSASRCEAQSVAAQPIPPLKVCGWVSTPHETMRSN